MKTFATSICIADNADVTLPVEITLSKDVWCMIARVSRFKEWTYGRVLSEIALDGGMASLCQLDDEARSERQEK